jgi:hypothetical protein
MQADGSDRRLESPPIPLDCFAGYGLANWSPNGSEIAAEKAESCCGGSSIQRTCFLDLAGGEECWWKLDVELLEAWSPDAQQLCCSQTTAHRTRCSDAVAPVEALSS